jgi:hypothetical protein
MINSRTETGTGVIPAGTAITGATISSTVDPKTLAFTGITAQAFKNLVQTAHSTLWLYIPSTNVLRKIEGFPGDLLIRVTENLTGVSGLAFQIVDAKLYSWYVDNIGAANGLLDGAALADGSSISDTAPKYPAQKVKDAITFDATGTTFVIREEIL